MKLLGAILLLPFPVLIVIPGGILYFTHFRISGAGDWQMYLALLLLIKGIWMAVWSVGLFTKLGEGGTPAPWAPPKRLIVAGPYRYVRNPMLSGVFLLLLAETFFFQSAGLAVWTALFVIANLFWFPFFEEPGLRKRFGAEFEEYCRNVPRYIPRLTPWTPGDAGKTDQK